MSNFLQDIDRFPLNFSRSFDFRDGDTLAFFPLFIAVGGFFLQYEVPISHSPILRYRGCRDYLTASCEMQ